MKRSADESMMDRALGIATRGRPSPNPHVGAVVVLDGQVVGAGHHERAGLAHAEVVALEAAGAAARGATLYVTLEPCNHFGRTPPCTDAIVSAGIRRVVIGCADPVPHVPGAVEKLHTAGVEVTMGVREERARACIADFAKHRRWGLPFVTLKSAITLDGRTATRSGDSKWISGPASRKEGHRMRARADAVVVGVGTVLADDPELTVRAVRGGSPPRVVLDTQLRTPPGARLFATGVKESVWLVHGPLAPADRRAPLAQAGALLLECRTDSNGRVDLESALRLLGERGAIRLLVEGGARVHGSLLDANLADRVALFIAPRILGDPQARGLADGSSVECIADGFQLRDVSVRRIDTDMLVEGSLALATDRKD